MNGIFGHASIFWPVMAVAVILVILFGKIRHDRP